jgi:hypothetical protein
MHNILCIKWGSAYGALYVNRLLRMAKRHMRLPFRFICLTDDATDIDPEVEIRPIPDAAQPQHNHLSPWRKLAIFSPDLADIQGKTLFLDLDVVIVDDLTVFFEGFDDLTIIENWTQLGRGIGNSSVFLFRAGAHPDIFQHYQNNAENISLKYGNEQTYFSQQIADLKYWPKHWCRSFKFHAIPPWPWRLIQTPRLPEGCRILVFHGRPNPDAAITGAFSSWRKFYRPAPWIADYWQ